jgi:ferredoxin/flavodoxin
VNNAAIFYFSGTGNSLVAARDIAEKTNGQLISIPSVIDQEIIETGADVIGIVFPVYHAIYDGLPLIIERFIRKMEKLDGKYIFTVCTCKGWSRLAISKLAAIIELRGGKLAAGFTVAMPDNSNPTTLPQHQKRYDSWKNKKLEAILSYINSRKTGRYENTVLYNIIMAPLTSPLKNATTKLMRKLSNSPGLSFKQALPLTDKSFIANEKCTGCGTCFRVCPVNNIKIIDKKPVWQNHCESCLACLNWCPNEAISGSISTEGNVTRRYHHPEVKVADFFRRDA